MLVQEMLPQASQEALKSEKTYLPNLHWLNHAVLVFVVVCTVWKFSLPLRSHDLLLGYAQDDLYYYLKVAQNMAGGRGSTFDGVTLTNGYHPLYFLLWTAVSLFTTNIRTVFKCLWVLDVLSSAAIFISARIIFSRLTKDVFLRNTLALCILIPCIATISLQMETTLALPLGFAFLASGFVPLYRYTPTRCAWLGSMAALTILARLDAGFLILASVAGLMLTDEGRATFRAVNIVSFIAGAFPFLLYLAINQHYFHMMLPISGAAKQLRHGWLPDHDFIVTSFSGLSLVQSAFAAVSLLLMAWLWKYMRAEEKQLCVATFLFPFMFYGTESIMSAWKLWGWYMYALRFSNLGGLLVLTVLFTRAWLHRKPGGGKLFRSFGLAPALLGVSCLALAAAHYRIDAVMFEIETAAYRLSNFAQTHPGLYGMGDRAGMFGYLSPSPVLQSEGLLMDGSYLRHIRNQDDLRSTLNLHGARYYAVFAGQEETGQEISRGCFEAAEPAIAGKDALRMRGRFCEEPIYRFNGQYGEYRVYALHP